MELPLVVGVDGSEFALRAVDWATREAARHALPLRLVHATLWQRYEQQDRPPVLRRRTGGSRPAAPRARGERAGDGAIGPSERTADERTADAQEAVERAAARATRCDPSVRLDTEVVCEEAERALLHEARNATALIVGHRGCGVVPGMLLGTVALTLAGRAPCPVVVVRGSARNRAGTHHRVLLAAGSADSCPAAVRFAFREAALRDGELLALRAWRCPASQTAGLLRWPEDLARQHEQRAVRLLDEVLRPAERAYPQTDVVRSVVEGNAHEVLLARSREADLLVTGARRERRHLGAQLGRVAHTMLHHADCPVAVVPHRA